jgi:hypothetical protein
MGFRDLEREPVKPKGTRRVAMLGDSYIEAVQVPLELTAAQLLERKLNAVDADSRWEVMNFGISNYGIGQYLLAWEQYASNLGPDYVAIFVAKMHMRRTVDRYEIGAFKATQSSKLWVRPTFALEGDRLIREPAQDFERFEAAQQTLVENTFNGDRSRRRTMLVTGYYLRDALQRLNAARTRKAPERKGGSSEADAEQLAISLKIIEELGRNVERAGGRLIIVDVSEYLGRDVEVAAALEQLSRDKRFGYVPLSRQLNQANKSGIATRWPRDGHFNEAGNEILARALSDWITRSPRH